MTKKKDAIMKLLHYRILSRRGDSNARPPRPERGALPTALLLARAKSAYYFLRTKRFLPTVGSLEAITLRHASSVSPSTSVDLGRR